MCRYVNVDNVALFAKTLNNWISVKQNALLPPHPKDGEGNSFSLFVSSHPGGGDTTVPGSFPGNW